MNDLVSYAQKLFKLGYIPLRVERGSKAASSSGWTTIMPTHDTLVRTFARTSNIGIRLGDIKDDGTCLVAIDLDIDNAELVGVIERAIGKKVPAKRGQKGFTWFARIDRQVKTRKIYLCRDGKKVPVIDLLCRGAQSVIPPSIHPVTNEPYLWVTIPLEEVEYASLPVLTESALGEIEGFCRSADDPIAQLRYMEWLGVGGGGNTHDSCLAAVASMVSRGWTDMEIHARIGRAKREACEAAGSPYDWPEAEQIIQGWIDSARAKNFGTNPAGSNKRTHGVLADRFAAEHGHLYRYDRDRNQWYAYEGNIWKADHGHHLWNHIEQVLTPDLRNGGMVHGVQRSLSNRPDLSISQIQWDRAPHLLHTPGGTVDLRSGGIETASSSNFITKSTSVAPAPIQDDALWQRKLTEWFGDDEEELAYHQILAGYFLTGETRHPCLPIWIGPGGDGKSVIANTYRNIMGEYARTSTDTAFIETRHAQHSEELAWLRGARLVMVNEVSGTWNESRVKGVTGGENMAASFKGGKVFEFTPDFKLLVTGNQAPRLRSVGPEFRRRIHAYYFTRGVKNPDAHLPEKLREEYGQILSWMIAGAVKYYKFGLLRSPVVNQSSEEYFTENDTILQWMDERVHIEADAKIEGQSAYRDFSIWSEGAGIRFPLNRASFTRALKAKGFDTKTATVPGYNNSVRVYLGFKLKAPPTNPEF